VLGGLVLLAGFSRSLNHVDGVFVCVVDECVEGS
jgi:hypothetical protein